MVVGRARQAEQSALRWSLFDPLGMPLARQLLEDGQWQFDGVSGTSAGAMNAVAMAHGFAKAAQEHKDPHEAHQAGCQQARDTLTRNQVIARWRDTFSQDGKSK